MLVSACVTTAADPTIEALDERSGTTVTRLTDPVTFIAEKARRGGQDPFAFLAPFEANRMGNRRMHLWIVIPNESGATAEVAVLKGELELLRTAVTMDANRARELAVPYSTFATWQRAYLADLDAELLTKLAGGGRLTIEVRQAGASERFSTDGASQAELRRFQQRLGL
jgi:hypothetical protein